MATAFDTPVAGESAAEAELRQRIKRALDASMAQQAARYSPDQIAQRTAGNARMQDLGLLGMLSGNEQLGNVGGMLAKQAYAERAPHTTERGTYDPVSGQFTENPEVTRQRHLAEANALQNQLGAMQTRREDQTAQRSWQEQQQAAQRAWQESQNAANRAAMAANRGEARAAALDVRNATIEDRMADDYRTDTKTQQAVLNAHKNLAAIAQKPDAASDVAFVYSYMKMLDPGSVVREGEFATAQNAAGVPDRIRNLFNAALSGQRLNAQQRAEMLDTAGRLGAEAQTQIDSATERYAAKAQRRALNAENVTGRPTAFPRTLGGGQPQGGTPQGAPARAPSRGGAVKFSDLPQ